MSSLAPAGGAAPRPGSMVDEAVPRTARALHRHGTYFPSPQGELMLTVAQIPASVAHQRPGEGGEAT